MENIQNWFNGFIWVRDVYRNCFRILNCSDPILENYNMLRYNWDNIYDFEPVNNEWRKGKINTISHADALLPSYVFRQYYTRELRDKEIITLGTAPWRKVSSERFRPVCYMTRFMALSTIDDVYWIGAMPLWQEDNISDGKVHEFDSGTSLLSVEMRKKFEEVVSREKPMIGAAIPLFDVSSSTELENKLVRPFLASQW